MPESEAVRAHDAPISSARPMLHRFGTGVTLIRPRCYRSDDRLRCHDTWCRWRGECRRLIAEWRR